MLFSQVKTLSVKSYFTCWALEPFLIGQIIFPAQSTTIFTKGIVLMATSSLAAKLCKKVSLSVPRWQNSGKETFLLSKNLLTIWICKVSVILGELSISFGSFRTFSVGRYREVIPLNGLSAYSANCLRVSITHFPDITSQQT